ncbi:putative oxidoreductase YjmC [Brachyhypopomus gauderio]|uniref:putative oxidoreductase YjmC n=1 Tax=Brachyhypopomus gauderio TaxID=698409 RepID=UPI00404350E2
MAYTNASPRVLPTQAKEITLGTNPLSVAAPAGDGDSFVLDMATSAVAFGKVEIHERNAISIPEGWGCDAGGRVSTDPRAVMCGGGLVPLGGSETTGGHKGYGLSLMVEVFCGMLAGAQYSKYICAWKLTDHKADLGQCFVAVNPGNFASGFNDRMSDLLSLHRNLEAADPGIPVMVAGDPERKHMQTCQELGGIPYYLSVVKHVNEFAHTLGVRPLLPTHRLIQ